ncbi:MAG: hypothetical protein WDO71_15065 [Bacteroidota bacterium]
MKYLLLLLHIFSLTNYLAAQGDTTIIYLDKDDKPCPEARASKYAVQTKEKDHWKKVVFDIADDKPFSVLIMLMLRVHNLTVLILLSARIQK